MSFPTLLTEERDQVVRLTMNRPERRNALSRELIRDLLAALAAHAPAVAEHGSGEPSWEHGGPRALLLTGAGSAFCSGMDLDEVQAIATRTPQQNLEDSRSLARLFSALYSFALPTIAVVSGPALAGGCGLATLCDFTLAASTATFGYPEVRIGFVPALVSAWLCRQLGDRDVRRLLLGGKVFSAAEALSLGLVTEVVEPERLETRAEELARDLLRASPASLVATKRLLNSFGEHSLQARLELAVDLNATLRSSADFHEGISAFLEKRKPRWAIPEDSKQN